MSKQKQLNRTALYMRLSRDDEKAGESMSIENQRVILKKYAEENGGTVVDEYIDDGWSGTDFDRPSVKRLLDDAKEGKIDTIVVKDLSRFGRNYIQVGQYIDYIFPAYGIRFIALSDNVDTADRTSAGMDDRCRPPVGVIFCRRQRHFCRMRGTLHLRRRLFAGRGRRD